MPSIIQNYGYRWNWAEHPNQKVVFDGATRVIYVNEGVTEVNVKTDLYSGWKEWVRFSQQGPNASAFLGAFSVVGGEDITNELSVGATFFLENGWRIQPFAQAGLAYTLTINGNLFTREVGENPFLLAAGVSVSLVRSNIVDLIRVESLSANITQEDIDAIKVAVADQVWDELVTDHTIEGTTGKKLKDNLTQIKYIARI
jgi:hypothetical protein